MMPFHAVAHHRWANFVSCNFQSGDTYVRDSRSGFGCVWSSCSGDDATAIFCSRARLALSSFVPQQAAVMLGSVQHRDCWLPFLWGWASGRAKKLGVSDDFLWGNDDQSSKCVRSLLNALDIVFGRGDLEWNVVPSGRDVM